MVDISTSFQIIEDYSEDIAKSVHLLANEVYKVLKYAIHADSDEEYYDVMEHLRSSLLVYAKAVGSIENPRSEIYNINRALMALRRGDVSAEDAIDMINRGNQYY